MFRTPLRLLFFFRQPNKAPHDPVSLYSREINKCVRSASLGEFIAATCSSDSNNGPAEFPGASAQAVSHFAFCRCLSFFFFFLFGVFWRLRFLASETRRRHSDRISKAAGVSRSVYIFGTSANWRNPVSAVTTPNEQQKKKLSRSANAFLTRNKWKPKKI